MAALLNFRAEALRRRVASAAAPQEFRAEQMEPPKPGEKCSLCGQVMPAPVDEVVASALATIDLCQKAGIPYAAAALLQVKLSGAEMKVLANLQAPDLRNAILRRASAALWDDVIAEQNMTSGTSHE
jgi:hypothetical protein